MARIRSIKPDFWTDEKIVFLSPWARLLFIGLWNFADDAGRMAYSPMRLKMQIFPNDNIEIQPLIKELDTAKLVTVYQNGTQVLQIVNFGKHQKIDTRTESRLPPPDSTDSPDSPQIPPEIPQEGKGVEGKRNVREKKTPPVAVAPVDERKSPVRDAIKKGYCWANKIETCPWGPAEEKALSTLLADLPKDFPAENVITCVRNKFLSDEPHGRQPRAYIRLLLTYMESPLDRFGKPKTLGGVNGQPTKASQRQQSSFDAIRAAVNRANERATGNGNGSHEGSLHQPGPAGGDAGRDDAGLEGPDSGVRRKEVQASVIESQTTLQVLPNHGRDKGVLRSGIERIPAPVGSG